MDTENITLNENIDTASERTTPYEVDRDFEKEFEDTCKEVAYYQGDSERTTLDGEWTESELKDDVYDETVKILNGHGGVKGWLEVNKGRAVKDVQMTKAEFIANKIADTYDLVVVYNNVADKHRNDEHRMFGIHYFDELVHIEVNKILKANLAANNQK